MNNIDSIGHVTGASVYLDDIPLRMGTLFALPYEAPIAHARITKIDYTNAEKMEGVVRIFTYKDIQGENQIGGIFPDEPLFAENEIHFWGMPIALIIAESEYICRKARDQIKIELEPLPVIIDPRKARKQNLLTCPSRTFTLGKVDEAFALCDYIYEGQVDSNGQEHLYIETQGAYAYPSENGSLRIASSTQGPTAVQRTIAKVLGIPMHKIEVDVTRLGGGFGGKEDQATAWAVMVALASYQLQKPVKYSMHRMDDMRMTGKRHPYSSDYKIGLSKDLKILAYAATFHQNAGAAADLSPAVMERTLFHSTNCYFVPNVQVTAFSCRTNLPPNTAFRGFGGPQGMFVIESAIRNAAKQIGVKPREIQAANLLQDGDEFPYGQIVQEAMAMPSWKSALTKFQIEKIENDIALFNSTNKQFKKGMAVMPICFGISFTNTQMNNARALVHIYQDGSIGISTGGVEMGQGLNTKMVQVAMSEFSVSSERIKIETTNTTRVSNTSPSAASATSDLNGKALEKASRVLVQRLKETAAKHLSCQMDAITFQEEWIIVEGKKSKWDWNTLVRQAFMDRVSLTENGHYATPEIHFDKTKEKGHPFAYHVYGTSITEVTVDCLRGIYEIDSVKIVHDFGKSMNRPIDYGQIEGGLVQGIGWMTMEELLYGKDGKLLSNALSTYKIPDIYSVPRLIEIAELESDGHDLAIQKSKAVGEPPLMYGMGAYFAIQSAIKEFNPNYKLHFDAPFTPEKVLMALNDH